MISPIYNKTDAQAIIDVFDPNAPNYMKVVLLPEDELIQEYQNFLAEDPGVEQEALQAAKEMRLTPFDDLDSRPMEKAKRIAQVAGKVGRRAPPNPFHSPKLGKFRAGQGGRTTKVEDPALQGNPLRGRLVVNIAVNSALLLVFSQALIYNRLELGRFYASHKDNSNIGPASQTLFDLGGLNANSIRRGEWIRIFWSMWMHSGWLHIGLNVICQIQYFYMLEPDWGAVRTILLFWVAGISGNLMSVICDPCKTTVGSSGGLFGLMGGVVPYCIEFWHTIPRPLCILVFSIVVLVVSLATGLSSATDTWAHFGGLIGGILFGFGTITTPAAFLPKERVLKKQLRKNAVMRWLQQAINPDCKCGLREWIIRLLAWALLSTMWAVCLVHLFQSYEYQPPGSLTYQGITKCCCCYEKTGVSGRENWFCLQCDYVGFPGDSTYATFGEYCKAQSSSKRLLLGLDDYLAADTFFETPEDLRWHPVESAIFQQTTRANATQTSLNLKDVIPFVVAG